MKTPNRRKTHSSLGSLGNFGNYTNLIKPSITLRNISKNKMVSGTPAVNLKTYLKQSVLLKKMVEK